MEDRNTPGLYLEMIDGPLDDYVATRVPDVMTRPGVARATWWRNVKRDRTDLPRVLDEFDHLAVYEVDETFTKPDGGGGLHFARTSRPAQGIITGRPTIGLSLVLISPHDRADAQALRDWADFVHIRHIAEVGVPGFCMITPYRNADDGDPLFMHFYEMDTDDPEKAFRSMPQCVIERIGDTESDAFKQWAWHPSLRIMYVNSFALVGATPA
jgi:hypothetical protein